MSATMLNLENVHAYYGKSHILHGVDMKVNEGEIVSLLGRNGSGRSTTVKTIMGLVEGTGSVKFRDHEVLGLKAFAVAIIGGLTSGMGIIVGGIILGVAETTTGFYLSTGYKDVPGLVLLLLVLALKPAGLFGKTAIKKV